MDPDIAIHTIGARHIAYGVICSTTSVAWIISITPLA